MPLQVEKLLKAKKRGWLTKKAGPLHKGLTACGADRISMIKMIYRMLVR
jgi:hypothetical protein